MFGQNQDFIYYLITGAFQTANSLLKYEKIVSTKRGQRTIESE